MDYRFKDVAVESNRPSNRADIFASYQKSLNNEVNKRKEDEANA